MADSPIVFALANPDPEISYEEARAARPDAIVATGRSDYPNQVNNVLGFPAIFRGALDVQARQINGCDNLVEETVVGTVGTSDCQKRIDFKGGKSWRSRDKGPSP